MYKEASTFLTKTGVAYGANFVADTIISTVFAPVHEAIVN
jgi:hypothetical protein